VRAIRTGWALLFLLAFLRTDAQAAPAKAQVSLCNPNVFFILKEDGTFWDRPAAPSEYVIEVARMPDDGSGVPMEVKTVTGIVAEEDPPTFLKAVLPEPIRGNASYRVTVRETANPEATAAGDFTTRPRGRLRLSGARAAEAHFRFEVFSGTPLIQVPKDQLNLVEILRKPLIGPDGKPTLERRKNHRVDVHRQAPEQPDCELPLVTEGMDGLQSGGVIVDLRPDDRLSSGSSSLRLEGLRDVFGQPVSAEGNLVPAKVPKGRDDAFVFTKVLFESAEGRGSLDTLSLDLKLQPLFQMKGRWLFRPELTASVSKNVPRASNSIRLAGLFSRTAVRREGVFVYQTYSLGPSLESDRNFDRVNAIADLRWQPGLQGFYNSREVQRIALAAELGRRADEVALPRTGYGLEFRIGAEAGASTSRQTVKNSAGNRSLELDRYEVLRVRPHVNAFYEVGLPLDWQLTVNVSSSLRYLLTEELTAVENPDRSLSLREIDGFEPYTEATLSLAFDPGQHVALAVTYKDGAEPPVFVEVDRYSVGVVLKY
jgi:hypothetical protein